MKSQPKSSQLPRKKRVLYVITQGTWGGAQRYIFDLAKKTQHTQDICVAIGSPTENELRKQLENEGIRTIPLPHLIRPISPWHDVLALLSLVRLYKSYRPDVVHLNSTKAGILGSVARRFSPVPFVVYTVHGWVFLEPMSKIKRALYLVTERLTLKYKDSLIVLSQNESQVAITQVKAPLAKVAVIPLGIDWSDTFLSRHEARNHLTSIIHQDTNKHFLVGTIANFFPTKGLDILIRAVAQIQSQLPANIRFVLIGDGPEKQKIIRLCNDLGLQDKIFFAGFQKNASELLKAFDLFVLPSRKEGLPYVVLEAISANVPIVATKVGGIPEILTHQESGLLSKADPKELGDNLLFAYQNPDKLTKFVQRAKKIQTTYSQKQMVDSTQSLYQQKL